jgi:hypothetical protein
MQNQNKATRIAMWSTPRSLSTALMRAWDNRQDTIVIDEPLNGVDIVLSGWEFDGMETTLSLYETDWKKAVAQLFQPLPKNKSIFYQKHLALHTTHKEIDLNWILDLTNCFLIRNPKEVITSYLKKWPTIDRDLGFPQLQKLFKLVQSHTGTTPPVIDARDLQDQPRVTLEKLCERIGVPFSETMLSWDKGVKATDGPWKSRGWYDNVSNSTGFKPYKERNLAVPVEYQELYERCEEIYQELRAFKI